MLNKFFIENDVCDEILRIPVLLRGVILENKVTVRSVVIRVILEQEVMILSDFMLM